MTAAQVFSIVNLLPLPVWATWILAPRSGAARSLAHSLWPWLVLAAIYLVSLVIAIVHEPTGGSFSSLEGVMALFDSHWGALAGWVHYLCFDMFVGRWIMNDAPAGGYRLAVPLFLTLMVGPVGLLLYLGGRRFFQNQP